MKDGVLVEVNWLDIVLIVVGVVESVVSLVLGVPFNIVVGGLVVCSSLVMRDFVRSHFSVNWLVMSRRSNVNGRCNVDGLDMGGLVMER